MIKENFYYEIPAANLINKISSHKTFLHHPLVYYVMKEFMKSHSFARLFAGNQQNGRRSQFTSTQCRLIPCVFSSSSTAMYGYN